MSQRPSPPAPPPADDRLKMVLQAGLERHGPAAPIESKVKQRALDKKLANVFKKPVNDSILKKKEVAVPRVDLEAVLYREQQAEMAILDDVMWYVDGVLPNDGSFAAIVTAQNVGVVRLLERAGTIPENSMDDFYQAANLFMAFLAAEEDPGPESTAALFDGSFGQARAATFNDATSKELGFAYFKHLRTFTFHAEDGDFGAAGEALKLAAPALQDFVINVVLAYIPATFAPGRNIVQRLNSNFNLWKTPAAWVETALSWIPGSPAGGFEHMRAVDYALSHVDVSDSVAEALLMKSSPGFTENVLKNLWASANLLPPPARLAFMLANLTSTVTQKMIVFKLDSIDKFLKFNNPRNLKEWQNLLLNRNATVGTVDEKKSRKKDLKIAFRALNAARQGVMDVYKKRPIVSRSAIANAVTNNSVISTMGIKNLFNLTNPYLGMLGGVTSSVTGMAAVSHLAYSFRNWRRQFLPAIALMDIQITAINGIDAIYFNAGAPRVPPQRAPPRRAPPRRAAAAPAAPAVPAAAQQALHQQIFGSDSEDSEDSDEDDDE